MGEVIQGAVVVWAVFLAALLHQGFGLGVIASGKITIAFFEAELGEIVLVHSSLVDFVKLLQYFLVLFFRKIIHAQVIMSLGHKSVDGILADKVAKQEGGVMVAQFGGA